MKTLKAPFVGSYNQRPFIANAGKDQVFKACTFSKIVNKATNSATYYTNKRTGVVDYQTIAAGQAGQYLFYSISKGITVATYANTIYYDVTNCGVLTDGGVNYAQAAQIIETILNGITFYLINSREIGGAGTTRGWYLASDSVAQSTYTGKTTAASVQMDGITAGTGTAGMYSGQLLTSANLSAGTRVSSVLSTTQITVTPAATGTGTAALTKTPLAKILSVNFPVGTAVGSATGTVGSFAEGWGYIFIMTNDGRVYNSDLNSIALWTAGNYIAADTYTDAGYGVKKYKTYIVAFGTTSFEFFYNAGNPSGSPLSRQESLTINDPDAAGTGAIYIAESLYWTGADENIYTFNGYAPKKINSQNLFGGAGLSAVGGFSYDKFSYLALSHNGSGSAVDYWFCIDLDSLVQPNFAQTSATIYTAGIVGSGQFVYLMFGGADTTGKTFILKVAPTAAVFQDSGAAYTMSIQIQTDMGTNFIKFVNEIRIEADNEASGTLSVSYSDDDGVTFSTPRTIDMTRQRKRLTRLGSFVGTRLWKFEHSTNAAFRARQIEVDYTVGTR